MEEYIIDASVFSCGIFVKSKFIHIDDLNKEPKASFGPQLLHGTLPDQFLLIVTSKSFVSFDNIVLFSLYHLETRILAPQDISPSS